MELLNHLELKVERPARGKVGLRRGVVPPGRPALTRGGTPSDTPHCQEGVLLVAVERVSRQVRLKFLPNKEADVVGAALTGLLSEDLVQSLTYDPGLDWMRHEKVARALQAVSYFCLPYNPWEKGAVEQMNGLIRRFLPAGESFAYEEADHYWLELIEANLNTRPRRVLDYRTPREMARELTGWN